MPINILLRSATEGLWSKQTKEGYYGRTKEHWSQIYRQGKQYVVELGDCRGLIESEEFDEFEEAESRFNEYVSNYDLEEDKLSSIKTENKNEEVTLSDVVSAYMEAGDWLKDGMDSVLDEMVRDIRPILEGGLRYTYRNLFSNMSGFVAEVKIRNGKHRVDVTIDGSDLGHLVRNVQEVA